MRFKLTLRRLTQHCHIPLSYQHQISAGIYRLLERSSPQYAAFLHEEGYQEKNKRFKYFTFGQLQVPHGKWKIAQGRMHIQARHIYLEVSFLVNQASENFIRGVFQHQQLRIVDRQADNLFAIDKVEVLPTMVDQSTLVLGTLSPLVIAHKDAGKSSSIYLDPESPNYAEIFVNNLISKYTAYAQHVANAPMLATSPVPKFEFLHYRHPKPKLVTIKPQQNVKVKGYLFDFRLTAPVEMLKVGFYGGFGRACSYGMGMTKVVI
jgi:CRISPR-associated endoribonuclease Cas6